MTPNTEDAYCDEIKRLKANLDKAEAKLEYAATKQQQLMAANREAKQVIKYLAAQIETGP